jgi:Permuted papain-like amidase enzyme, YaeF/YiiX, C92 family
MRLIILLVAICLSTSVISQRSNFLSKTQKSGVKQLLLDKEIIYVFCRGTSTKSNLIAKFYNLEDTLSTHVGIGFFKEGKLNIYNVSTNPVKSSALRIETIEEFINPDDVYSLTIWKVDLSKKEKLKVMAYCSNYRRKKIKFDYRFTIAKDDTLYCSEFCANLFNTINAKKFHFTPVSKNIEHTLSEVLLNKKVLLYYPVDFFFGNPNFIQEHSFLFKK